MEALAERIRPLLAGRDDVVEKRMFGGIAFLINGNMSVSASGNGGLPLDLSAPEVPYWPETSRSSIHFRWRVIFRKRQRDGSAEAGTPDSRTSATSRPGSSQNGQICLNLRGMGLSRRYEARSLFSSPRPLVRQLSEAKPAS